jgi:hypothetical protein
MFMDAVNESLQRLRCPRSLKLEEQFTQLNYGNRKLTWRCDAVMRSLSRSVSKPNIDGLLPTYTWVFQAFPFRHTNIWQLQRMPLSSGTERQGMIFHCTLCLCVLIVAVNSNSFCRQLLSFGACTEDLAYLLRGRSWILYCFRGLHAVRMLWIYCKAAGCVPACVIVRTGHWPAHLDCWVLVAESSVLHVIQYVLDDSTCCLLWRC